jgi:vitamin B12 transporter
VAGADYRHGSIESESAPYVDEWGAYANDTIEMGMLCVTLGIRLDRTEFGGNFTSPSLGATYRLNDNTLLRAHASQGFRAPTLADAYTGGFNYTPNPDLKPERVRSLQAGIETVAHETLRLKALIYQHFTDDVIIGGDHTSENTDKRRIRGGEIEVEARPLDMVSLKAGAAYADIKTSTKDAAGTFTQTIYQYNLGVAYDNPASFKAELTGHYSWWDVYGYTLEPKYNGFIVDAGLTRHLDVSPMSRLDIFLTAHNIFNASQYTEGAYKNPRRWVEGGLSVAF